MLSLVWCACGADAVHQGQPDLDASADSGQLDSRPADATLPAPDSATDQDLLVDAPTADLPPAGRDPVILVHGVNGSSANYKVMLQRLVQDGWPQADLITLDYPDPKWGCNLDNAKTLQHLVQQVLKKTGRARVDLVAHSMGTLSSRYYIKNLGGSKQVNTYVTLGGMHHGLDSPCMSPLNVCVWKELCSSGPFMTQLNKAPATPGKLRWVSIYGTADKTVPNKSSQLTGAENIKLQGVEHAGAKGLLEHLDAYKEVKRVLQYPAW